MAKVGSAFEKVLTNLKNLSIIRITKILHIIY